MDNLKKDTVMTICCICDASFEAKHNYGLCSSHFSRDILREYDRIETARRKATQQGLPADISLLQWLGVISDTKGLCMLCEEYTYQYIEMYRSAKGLVHGNVFPCCRACKKFFKGGIEIAKERVKLYLESNREAKPSPINEEETKEDITI